MSQHFVYDFSKLRGRIVEKFGSQKNFIEAMGWNNSSLAMKLANRYKFSVDEIVNICVALEIPKGEISDYFFVYETKETL